MLKKFSLFLILFAFFANTNLQSQDWTDLHWYFGNSTSNLQFDKAGDDVFLENNQAIPFGRGGSAVISDPYTGDLLFYTDGVQVFDFTHQLVPNGTNLAVTADRNQSATACPIPGEPDRFIIFSNTSTAITYAIVDKSVDGNITGSGDVDLGTIGTATGITNPAEGMIIVPNADHTAFWLIAQDISDFSFQVLEIDVNGAVGVPVSYDFVTPTNPAAEAVQFAYNEVNNLIAVAPRESNRNVILLDFDRNTGVLAFNRPVLNSGQSDDAGENIFDVAWSASGQNLYMSRFGTSTGNSGNVMHFDLNDTLELVNDVLGAPVYRSLGLKRGPDNNIYHLYQQNNGDPTVLGRILQSDSAISAIQYELDVFGDDFDGIQFPEFAPSSEIQFDSVNFSIINDCLSDPIILTPYVQPTPASYFWEIDDGQQSDAQSPVFSFPDPGPKIIRLTVELNGFTETFTSNVTISTVPDDFTLDLGNDTTICPGDILQLDATIESAETFSYLWNTGETTPTIDVDSAGTYWVKVLHAAGCSVYDAITVNIYREQPTIDTYWYFGERAGILFGTAGTTALADGNLMSSPEGCATATDSLGNVSLYTNGSTVWNRRHEIMENGTNIGGDSTATMSALIIPASFNYGYYYIFTNEQVEDGNYQMSYSIVDLKYNEMGGRVIAKNIPLFKNSTEKLTTDAFVNGASVIGKEFGNNTFRTNQVTETGIQAVAFSQVGTIHPRIADDYSRGYIDISQNRDLLAVVIQDTAENFIEIFDFDSVGGVSNPRLINIDEQIPSRIYGVSFSTDGSKIFTTTDDGSIARLLQFDLDSLDTPNGIQEVEDSKNEVATGTGYGALERAPNGQLYMAIENSPDLGLIGGENTLTPSITNFNLAGRTSRRGLPNYEVDISSVQTTPGMTINEGCVGIVSTFDGSGRDPYIETYSWDLGVPGLANMSGQSITHTYTSPGIYTVQLTLSNDCEPDTVLTQTIEIFAAPEQPTNPAALAYCGDPVTIQAYDSDTTGLSFFWLNGETTNEITVDAPGFYQVYLVNSNGCISDTVGTSVVDARPVVNLGPNRTYCQDELAARLNAGNPGATFTWTINGVPSDTTQFQSVDTSVPGIYEYIVEIIDPVSACINSDTVQISVQELPDVDITTTQTSACGADDGMIDITINSTGNFSYSVTGPTSVSSTSVDAPATIPSITNLAPGNYTIVVTNNVTSCAYTEVVQISDGSGWELGLTAIPECGSDGDIELTIVNPDSLNNPFTPNFFITILDESGNIVTDGNAVTYDGSSVISVNPLYQIVDLDTGIYYFSVQEQGGCVVTDTVTLSEPFPQPDISYDPIQAVCGDGETVSVTNNTGQPLTFTWNVLSGPGSLVAPSSTNVVSVQGGSLVLEVVTEGTNFCPRRDTIQVVYNSLIAEIVQMGNPCTGEVTLSVDVSAGTGPYSFIWSNGANTPTITVNQSGNYSVTIRDQTTGCLVDRNADVTLEELLTVDIVSEPDCDNNGEIFLIANSSREDVTFQWFQNGETLVGSTNDRIRVTESGNYTVTVTAVGGFCLVTDDFQVLIEPIDEDLINILGSDTFCPLDTENPTVILRAGAGFDSYRWRLQPDATILGTSDTLEVSSEGIYEVDILDGSACVSRQISVMTDCDPRLEAPNAFSPNGDGTNETFFVFPNDYVSDFQIYIYSAQGEIVYESDSMDFQWDGTFQGSMLPVGTYAYIIQFNSALDPALKPIKQRGTVTLIR